MGRSVVFRLNRANCYARDGSGFRRKSIQAGIGGRILSGILGDLWRGILHARGLSEIEGLMGFGGVGSRRDAALVSFNRSIKGGGRFNVLAIPIKPPAAIAERHHQSNKYDD